MRPEPAGYLASIGILILCFTLLSGMLLISLVKTSIDRQHRGLLAASSLPQAPDNGSWKSPIAISRQSGWYPPGPNAGRTTNRSKPSPPSNC